MQTGEGTWEQDSSEIIDFIEARHNDVPVVPNVVDAPRQAVASNLIELLADEWMVVSAFWERWYYCLPDAEPNHLDYNPMRWGSAFMAGPLARTGLPRSVS